ncbi:hypothetical protein Q7P37_004559 [Cladosporium fusiforme]
MVLAQSFHGDSELESYHRTSHRSLATTAYYDRAAPYSYYEPSTRHELLQEYGGRMPTHTPIQEPDEPLTAGGQARRRIAVAIQSTVLEIRSSDDNGADIRQYNSDLSPAGIGNGVPSYPAQDRPSLPTLQTRLAWPVEYGNQYESSPVDAYTYSSAPAPRIDSLGSSYAPTENFRNYSTSAPLSVPVSSPLCESNSYSFGTLLSPVPSHVSSSRLPSVSAEAVSALNMGSLHSSLPTHTPLERRLPVPFTINYPQQTYMSQTLPEPRLVDPATANFRPYINGIHSRNAMPWSMDSSSSRNNSLSAQLPSYQSTSPSQHHQATSLPATTSSLTDPVLGYQFQPQNAYSPDSSPSTVAAADEPFSTPTSTTASLLQPTPTSSLRDSTSGTSLPAISSCFDDSRPFSSRKAQRQPAAPLASLYSFSSEASERNASDSAVTEQQNKRELDNQGGENNNGADAAYSRFMHPRNQAQPRRPTNHDGLRGQSDFGHTRSGLEPAHQPGMRSLNDHY